MDLMEMGRRAKAARLPLARASTQTKNNAILAMARSLKSARDEVLAANRMDVDAGMASGMTEALLDRLTLNEARIEVISKDLEHVAELPDPVGERFEESVLPNGLLARKQRVPLGVLGVIYEARPNVTMDVAGLALKTGNASILRGGRETINTNLALMKIVQVGLASAGLPADSALYIEDTNRDRILDLLRLDDYVDMIIPRGGAGLHAFCRENSRIPVMTGGIGICHLFIDESADLEAAFRIIHNAKTQRPSVCNALDTVLAHKNVASEALRKIVEGLAIDGVTFRADASGMEIVGDFESVSAAGVSDFDTEWLSLVLGLKVVDGLDEAIEHIRQHSTGHSDGILTRDQANADRFVEEVDSAAVYVNASTRFTDGSQLGLGAEVAVSTQRLHARGPMGLKELTTYKWVIIGDGHVRG